MTSVGALALWDVARLARAADVAAAMRWRRPRHDRGL